MATGPEHRDVATPPVEHPAAPAGHDGATGAELGARPEDIERLRSERDAAVAALDRQGRRDRRRSRIRRYIVGVLVVVFALLLPVTAVVGWAHNTVLNTDGWVRTVGPLASEPAVTAALSAEITSQAFTALDAQAEIAGALPPKAAFLAGPITNGVEGYVRTAVNNALNTEQFQAIWVQANRFAHQQLVDVLRGKSKALATTNGEVVLNLVPLLNAALQQVGPFISGLVGRPVTLPAISSNEVPASACQKISAALGRPVPDTCGQVALFPADKLDQARRLVQAFDRVTVLLIVLTPVVVGLALWISRRRRRTILQLTVGGVIGVVVVRRVLWWLESSLVATGKPENKAARQAIVSQLTHGFFTLTTWILVGLVVVFVFALLSGPYPWARSFRANLTRAGATVGALAVATAGKARDERTVGWVRAHMSGMQIGGIAVAVVLMLILSVSFIGFLVIAALLAIYELWLRRLARANRPPTETPNAPVGN